MFNLFKKKEHPSRKALRLEFEEIINCVGQMPKANRISIGHTINMAYSLFYKKFTSVDNFMSLNDEEQIEYMKSINEMQNKLAETDPISAFGYNLFGKWVAAISENDGDLISQFTKSITPLSREGDLGGLNS